MQNFDVDDTERFGATKKFEDKVLKALLHEKPMACAS